MNTEKPPKVNNGNVTLFRDADGIEVEDLK